MATTQPAELNNGVWTSWLPVTAAWPSQPACNSAAWARDAIQTSNNYWPYIYDPAYGQSVDDWLTCLPPEATQWWDGPVTSAGILTQFSLGPLACPAAYTTVSTIVVSTSSTSVRCCPSNFDFTSGLPANPGLDGVCKSAMTSGQSITYAIPIDDAFKSYTTVTTTYSAAGLLIAVPVEGYNFAVSTSSPSQTSAGPTSSPSQTAPASAKSGLATGAKAGIGIAVAASVVIVAAAVLALFTKRRRRGAQLGKPTGESTMSELPGTGMDAKTGPHELPQNSAYKVISQVELP